MPQKNTSDLVAFFTVMLVIVIAITMLYDRRGRRLHYLGDLVVTPTYAHEHQPGETSEQARVVEFYKTWHRPKGEFSITHRSPMCCYGDGRQQDCFPVLARRINEKGEEELTPDVTGAATEAQAEYGGKWYPNVFHVTEDEQIDPRDSPDGRSHMCVSGQAVICYVRGWGQ